jgi:hypothetical protein
MELGWFGRLPEARCRCVGALMYVGFAAGLPWAGINGEHITTWARTGCVIWMVNVNVGWVGCECEYMW